jgi:putative DNA methylase
MTWDFAEGNPFSNSSGNITSQVKGIADNLDNLPQNRLSTGIVTQEDAASSKTQALCVVILPKGTD